MSCPVIPALHQPGFARHLLGALCRVVALAQMRGSGGKPIRRIITRDYQIIKTVDQAIISHSKILIGKNVQIEGELGARFDEVDFEAGDPIVMRSDFLGLDPVIGFERIVL